MNVYYTYSFFSPHSFSRLNRHIYPNAYFDSSIYFLNRTRQSVYVCVSVNVNNEEKSIDFDGKSGQKQNENQRNGLRVEIA